MQKRTHWKITTEQMTTMAILAGIASVLFLIEVPIVAFYKLDFSNLPVLLGTFAFGPIEGLMILGVKSLIGWAHTTSQGVGEVADFLVGAAMVIPTGLLYQKNKSRKRAILGMAVGTVAATVAAAAANLWLLIPFFSKAFHLPLEQIVAMGQQFIPALDSIEKFVLMITTPFNLLKWVALSILCALIYKPLSPLLRQVGKRQKRN